MRKDDGGTEMRAIDADPLKNRLTALVRGGTNLNYCIADEIDRALTIEPEPHWIPCSERLPEDPRQVLVYARNVHYALAKYDEMREADGTYKKQWVTFDAWKPYYTIKDVIKWMPLPEAYKGNINE